MIFQFKIVSLFECHVLVTHQDWNIQYKLVQLVWKIDRFLFVHAGLVGYTSARVFYEYILRQILPVKFPASVIVMPISSDWGQVQWMNFNVISSETRLIY